MNNAIQVRNLNAKIESCMKRDRHVIRRMVKKLTKLHPNDSKYDSLFTNIQDIIKSSVEVQQRRENNLPKVIFQDNLPIHGRLEEKIGRAHV